MATDTKRAPRGRKLPVQDTTIAAPSIRMIPLALLNRAVENVRHTNPDNAIESLADDIAAHGLLQSLIGYYVLDDGEASSDQTPVNIIGGGRRLQALGMLLARETIAADYQVPVLIRDRAEAVELSLAENLARRDMNPADEFVAFQALMQRGNVGPADLAKRFGFTEQFVRQRLRLAALAGPILDAIRDNTLTLTSAYAYAATADTALQLRVFEQQAKSPYNPHSEWSIKQAYASSQATTGSRLFKLVGAEAFEAAGGEYDDDLFDDETDEDGERRLRNGDLLIGLAEPLVEPLYEALIPQAKATYPTLGMVELCPGFVAPDAVGGKMPKGPSGSALIQHSYDATRNVAECLAYAVDNRIEVSFAAGIDRDGKLALVTDRFWVPGDRKAEVQPLRVYEDYNSPEKVAAREAERLESSIMGHAVRLAAIANRKAAVEGRVYWDRGAWAGAPSDGPDDLGPCYSVVQKVYVTVEEAEAFREEGKALHETEQARIAEHHAKVAADKEAAAAVFQQAIADLVEQEPAVVAIQRGMGDDDVEVIDIIARIADGNYVSLESGDGTIRTDLTTDVEDAEPLADHLNNYGKLCKFTALASVDEAKIACAEWFITEEDDAE